MILQRQTIYLELAEYSHDEGKIVFFLRKELKESDILINGFFDIIDNKLFLFYRHNNELVFRTSDCTIVISEKIKATLVRKGENNVISLTDNNRVVFSHEYRRVVLDSPLDRDFVSSFVEEEDFDFFLFVYNIIKDHERNKIIFSDNLSD